MNPFAHDGGIEPRPELPPDYKPRKRFQFGLRSLLLLTVVIGLLLSCVVNLPAILGWAYKHWQIGEQYDQCMFEGAQFSLRITAFHERGTVFAAPGGYYRYEVKTAPGWQWRKIIMYRLPTPSPIPRNQFRRLGDACAYFFVEDLFGITRDGGSTWLFRGGFSGGVSYPPFAVQQLDPLARIGSLTIDEDGTGMIRLLNWDYVKFKSLPDQDFETVDFGGTWTEMRPQSRSAREASPTRKE